MSARYSVQTVRGDAYDEDGAYLGSVALPADEKKDMSETLHDLAGALFCRLRFLVMSDESVPQRMDIFEASPVLRALKEEEGA